MMKKIYIQPTTEIVMVGAMSAMMLTLSTTSADSTKDVLSKERGIIDFSQSYTLDEE